MNANRLAAAPGATVPQVWRGRSGWPAANIASLQWPPWRLCTGAPLPARAIDSPTFCHGIAGLLATTLRFARDTNAPVFIEESRKLTTQLIESFQPDSLLGFRSMEYRNNETDQPGLLDGAAGVALVLLAQAYRCRTVMGSAFPAFLSRNGKTHNAAAPLRRSGLCYATGAAFAGRSFSF